MPFSAALGAQLDRIDLADPQSFVRMGFHRVFKQLRDHDPVHWNPDGVEPGSWSVTR